MSKESFHNSIMKITYLEAHKKWWVCDKHLRWALCHVYTGAYAIQQASSVTSHSWHCLCNLYSETAYSFKGFQEPKPKNSTVQVIFIFHENYYIDHEFQHLSAARGVGHLVIALTV